MSSAPGFLSSQADHLVRRGRPLVQQGSVDLDVPEEKIPKRASTELVEADRLEDLETCMVDLDYYLSTLCFSCYLN